MGVLVLGVGTLPLPVVVPLLPHAASSNVSASRTPTTNIPAELRRPRFREEKDIMKTSSEKELYIPVNKRSLAQLLSAYKKLILVIPQIDSDTLS